MKLKDVIAELQKQPDDIQELEVVDFNDDFDYYRVDGKIEIETGVRWLDALPVEEGKRFVRIF